MVTGARRFVRFCKCAPDHDGIRAASEGFANIAALAHAAVGDDRNVARGFFEVGIAGSGAVNRGRDLRHAETKDAARSAGGTGTDPDQNCCRSAFHNLEGNVEADGVTDDDWDPHFAAEFFQVERFILRRHVAHG